MLTKQGLGASITNFVVRSTLSLDMTSLLTKARRVKGPWTSYYDAHPMGDDIMSAVLNMKDKYKDWGIKTKIFVYENTVSQQSQINLSFLIDCKSLGKNIPI